MKPVSIHPLSALAGVGLLGLVLLATGAVQTPGQFQKLGRWFPGPIQVEGIPTPQQMMRIVEGQPFTVPPGKLFVVTGLGLAQLTTGFGANLRIDGQAILTYHWSSGVSPFGDVPPGLVASAGSVVSTDTTTPGGVHAVVLGYLADA